MKVSKRNNHRKVKKPVIIAGIVALVALSVLLVSVVVKSLGNNGPLAMNAPESYTLSEYDNIKFNVTFTNSKSLNKVIESEIALFAENNKDKLTGDLSLNVTGVLNEEQNFMSLVFEHGSENVKDIYKTSNVDLNNYEVISEEAMYHDDLKGLSMLVRKYLAKDSDLTFNRDMYLQTVPEATSFKYVNFSKEGMTFLFDKEAFKTDEYKSTTIPYDEVLPYLHDDLALRLDKDFERPDLSNVRYIDPNKPMVSVTYDDGPLNATSLDVANYFADKNARLSFFWLGSRIEQTPDTVKTISDLGHEIANHSYDHSNFNELSKEELDMQTNGVNDKIKAITGQDRVLIRPPYGSANEEVRGNVKSPLIMWSIDTEDWRSRDEKVVYDEIVKTVTDGSIVLMHDLYESSTNAGKKFLDSHSDKYQFLTVTELHQYKGIPLVDGQLHFGARGY